MTKDERQAEPAPTAPDCPPHEARNRRLTAERESLKAELIDCSLLLKAATTGLISLDKNGLIVRANTSAVDLLGAEESFLLKKPISLFIAPEDQATFYISRSRVIAGTQTTPFEIKLRRKNGAIRSVRVTAQPIDTPGHHLPGMLLGMDDISAYRQALERSQFKADFANLLFSTIDDLATWPTADIDEVIIACLEKIGIVSGADRVYVCLFHKKKSRLSISHEWLGEGIVSPALKNTPVGNFLVVLKKITKANASSIADITTLPRAERAIHEGFHAAGTQSFFFTPLVYGRSVPGMIGCDAVRQTVCWSEDSRHLVRCVGTAIVHALIRKRIENASAGIRQSVMQLVDATSAAADDPIPEYDGPIEIIDEGGAIRGSKETGWRLENVQPGDSDPIDSLLLKDGKTASLACNHCNRQRQLDISEIRVIGTQLKATCVCGNSKFVKIDLRREHRKIVNLDGIFMRGPGDRLALKSDDWGHIEVHNLSRRGIGFKTVGTADIRVNDRLRVKFTLDNTAESIIQKTVMVRSVSGEVIGCQFEGQDACDVTLGFYMMN